MNKEILIIYITCYLDLKQDARLIDAIGYALMKTSTDATTKDIDTLKKYFYRHRLKNKMPLLYKKL